VLEFDSVTFGYGGDITLRDVTFTLGRGEFAALLGENGAGKSTLCRLCNGLYKPLRGAVRVNGVDTRTLKTSSLAGTIGYLFQNPDRQICRSTVREELAFGLDYAIAGPVLPRRKSAAAARLACEIETRCEEMLALFALPPDREPFGLSRGERQKLALASVLARRPPLLVLDEPTTGLDYRECMMIMGVIQDLHRKGAAILMITHDMELALDCAQRALVLSRGALVGDGPARQVLKDAALLERASLLPPQIPALAMALGAGFEEVYTVDDMAAAAVRRRPKGGTR
jgi:energy-coupling factor transport system ATP-binding protein